jgi:hypothetical protein
MDGNRNCEVTDVELEECPWGTLLQWYKHPGNSDSMETLARFKEDSYYPCNTE